MRTEFWAQRMDYNNRLDIAVVRWSDGRKSVAKPHFWETVEVPEGGSFEPTYSLDIREAQSLMDAMYAAGMRPTDAKPPNEMPIVKAMSYHLEDMRKLVFDRYDIRSIPK